MKTRFSLLYILVLVALLVSPTATMLTYYAITKDPHLRPLSLTEQSVAAFRRANRDDADLAVVAQVEWVPDRAAGFSRPQLERRISDAFKAKGVEVYVFFTTGVDVTRVTYIVGYSRIGPYTARHAGFGVDAAADAYHMYLPAG